MKKPFCLNPIRLAFKRASAETVYNDLVAPFFKLSKSRAFLAGSLASNAGIVGMGVFTNNLFGKFLDHLTAQNAVAFKNDLKIFCLCAGISAALWAIRSFSNEAMMLSWRDWARTKMVGAICSSDRRGGFIQASNGERAQTGQRIVEDTSTMVNSSTFLTLDGLKSASDVAAFSVVLFALSPSVCASVVGLSVVGVAVASLWSKKTQRIDDDINRHANNFRNAVVETAGNKQAIEMWRGEGAEIKGLKDKQSKLTQSVRERINIGMQMGAWSSFVGSASRLVPYGITGQDVLAPNSTTTIGKLSEISGAAGFLTNSTMWFLQVVPQTNYWVAVNKRLETFLIQSKASLPNEQVPHYETGLKVSVQAKQLSIAVKDQQPLCEPINLELRAGDRIALTGTSGCGKTTFLRQLAGVTPILGGSIAYIGLEGSHEALFTPQDPYVPDLSMPEILSYPKPGIAELK